MQQQPQQQQKEKEYVFAKAFNPGMYLSINACPSHLGVCSSNEEEQAQGSMCAQNRLHTISVLNERGRSIVKANIF